MPPHPERPPHRPADRGRRLVEVGRWLALGAASGLLAGLACWAFLTALDHVTDLRLDHPWLVGLLPVVGLAVAAAYQRFGGRAAEGGGLLLDQVHEPTEWVPRRMAPMVAVGTLASHLVGASVGREGTALQISGSLTDGLARALGLRPEDRRILLAAALGGGFGAVFGVPLAGLVFGLEVQRVSWHVAPAERPEPVDPQDRRPWWVPGIGRLAARDRAPRPVLLAGFRDGTWLLRVVATLAASVVGDRVVRALGHHHAARPALHVGIDAALLGRVALAGIAFGLAATAFIEATDLVHAAVGRLGWAPARPALGGLVVLAATGAFGRAELGLSLPLLDDALAGGATDWKVPALKLALTALCVGSGFIGGEVTPLFVIGTTLGSVVAPALGLSPVVGATIGFVSVFGAATNTPLTAAVVAFELFGAGAVAPTFVAAVVATATSGRRSIYGTQRLATATGPIPASARSHRVARPRRRGSGRAAGPAA